MKNCKITEHQLFALTANFTCGSSIIIISAAVAAAAKQDAWISVIITLIFGMFMIGMICFLGSKYPKMTFVEIIQRIFGKWIGWIAAAGFVFLSLHTSSLLLWHLNNFITSQSLIETPTYAINGISAVIVVIAVLYGIEAISRASEIFLYFISFTFILAMILVLPNANIDNLLPVVESGGTPILKGSVILSCFLTFPDIILFMIFPCNIDNISNGKKALIKGYLWGGFLIFLSVLMSILVLGSAMTAETQYPTYMLAKEINIGIIFSRLEFIIASVWITTLFIKITLYFYSGVVGFSQLFGVKNHKRLVIPLGFMVLIISKSAYTNKIYESSWDNLIWMPFITTFSLVLLILLLIVFFIKLQIKNIK